MPVFFLFPYYLFLLPLTFLPFLWHRLFRKKILHTEIASLYFLKRLIRERTRSRVISANWEMILEMLFIFLIILAFAHPVPRALTESVRHLYLFIDNSPSFWQGRHREEAGTVVEWARQKKEVQVFSWTEVLADLLPKKVENREDFQDYASGLLLENGNPQFQALAEYLRRHRDFLGVEDAEVILLSDLRANHFQSAFRFAGRGPAWLAEDSEVQAQLRVETLPNPVRFPGESEIVHVHAEGLSESAVYALQLYRILGTNRTLVHASQFPQGKGGGASEDLSVRLEEPGLHAYELRLLRGEETLSRHYLSLFACPKIRLGLFPERRTPAAELLRTMLEYDIKKGNVALDPVNFDLFLIHDFDRSESLVPFRGKKGIIFWPSGKPVRDLNDVLQRSLGLDLRIRKEKTSPLPHKPVSVFPAPLEILSPSGDERETIFQRSYQCESPGTILAFEDETPFLMRSGQVFVFAGDADPRRSDFLGSAMALPVILELLKTLNLSKTLQYERAGASRAEEGFRPVVENMGEGLRVRTGIFEDDKKRIHVNEDPEERLAPVFEGLKKHFPNLKKIPRRELSSSAGISSFFSVRSLLFLSAFLILTFLAVLHGLTSRNLTGSGEK
ncbi:MAG: BatA domain-containing protein [Spirochaetia bacterium]|nr:BatA domain-containing protein [Spirochaetia bacterium]